jgi:hypothetical protein
MRADLLALQPIRSVAPGEDELPALRPPDGGCDTAAWLAEHRSLVWDTVERQGAMLLRGFAIETAREFERAVLALTTELNADYWDLPRRAPGCRYVQDATEYPSSRAILFHNEASHTPSWPRYIWFYCERPPAAGGETPLARCDLILDRLPADVRSQFIGRGLRYVRNFVPALDTPWERFFGTDDPSAVASRCAALGIDLSWSDDGSLRTITQRPAVAQHPRRGSVFFNQILLHHPVCLDAATREALVDLLGPDGLPRTIAFGDGGPIPDGIVELVLAATVETAFCFEWQAGDVLMVDNVAIAHGRRAFEGDRCVRVALSAFESDRHEPGLAETTDTVLGERG